MLHTSNVEYFCTAILQSMFICLYTITMLSLGWLHPG